MNNRQVKSSDIMAKNDNHLGGQTKTETHWQGTTGAHETSYNWHGQCSEELLAIDNSKMLFVDRKYTTTMPALFKTQYFRIKLKTVRRLKWLTIYHSEAKNISPVVLLKSTLFGGSCVKQYLIFSIQYSSLYHYNNIQYLLFRGSCMNFLDVWFDIWLDLWYTWYGEVPSKHCRPPVRE